MKMYSYKRKLKKVPKRRLIVSLSCLLVACVGYFSYEYMQIDTKKDTPVFKEENVPVLALPNSQVEEKGSLPFSVDAKVVLDYYDGKDSKIENITKFEGVYRANQGVDYAFNKEEFSVLAMFSGEVKEVKDDPLFGKSVTINSKDVSVTYQSLKDVSVKAGDKVNQKDSIAKASSNIYNKDLGNHLHIVVEKNGKIVNPKTVVDKTLSEIK